MAVGLDTGGRRQAWARPGHRKGAEEMAVGRVAVKGGAVVVGREADEGPKENGGRAYALPPFVMRGYVLLRLPDQNTMTGLR